MKKKLFPKQALPIELVVFSAILTLAILMWFARDTYINYQQSLQEDKGELTYIELFTDILYLDETMSNSLRMAAITEDNFWLERYQKFNNKSIRVIKDIYAQDRNSQIYKHFKRLEDSINKIYSLDGEIIRHLKNGEYKKARDIIFDPDYRRVQDILTSNAEQLTYSNAREFRLHELHSKIVYFDEVLTMSAQLYVMTGDTSWKDRYYEYRPKITEAFNEAKDLAEVNYLSDFIQQAQMINAKIYEMEQNAFDLAEAGEGEKAGKILLDQQYSRQKQLYLITLNTFDEQIRRMFYTSGVEKTSTYQIKTILVTFSVFLLVISWIVVFGALRQWYRIRLELEAKIVKENKEALHEAKVKSTFLANMSHEIRTPMNTILGFSDLLKQTDLDDKQKTYLDTVASSGELLLGIINDILDYSKLDAGKVELEEIDFSLEYLLTDVFKMVHPRLGDKDIQTYVDIDKKVPLFLKGDPTRIRQILLNLLTNALKFTEKGEVGIIVRYIEQKKFPGYLLEFKVKDTGIGISKEGAAKLFQSFSQAEKSTTREFGGTGLGLAICKALVEAMGGNIHVESEVDQGSEFIFTVFVKEGKPSSQEKIVPLSKAQLKGKRVFIIDGNEKSRDVARKYCKDLELNVVGCLDTAQGALRKMDELLSKDCAPDIILSDISFSDMEGKELVEKLRSHEKGKDLRIIATPSNITIGAAQDADDQGYNGFLAKPITRGDLQKVVATVLGDYREEKTIVTRHMASEVSCKGVKVLVVDDSVPNQSLIRAYFENIGCQGEYASNGQEAVDMLKERDDFDMCLMDVQMPVMNGHEATRVIRKEISENLPVIALTASAMQEDKDECLQAGMTDFLTKPINVIKLKEKILQYSSKE